MREGHINLHLDAMGEANKELLTFSIRVIIITFVLSRVLFNYAGVRQGKFFFQFCVCFNKKNTFSHNTNILKLLYVCFTDLLYQG